MKKKTWLSGALALALLTGCGMVNPIAPADPDDMAYLAADVRRTDPLLTVDGVGINAEEYLFWLVNAVSEQQYYGAISGDEGWADTQADGTAGAPAVEVGAANLVNPYASKEIVEALPAEMERLGIERLSDIIGVVA